MPNNVRSRFLPYLRTRLLPSKPAQMLIQTWLKWDRDNVPGMAAALSYYALFSLFPLLLAGLQWLVSNSVISLGSRFVSYGMIGSVMILLLWIFLACQIFFAGCEFSYVYAHMFGTQRRAAQSGEQKEW